MIPRWMTRRTFIVHGPADWKTRSATFQLKGSQFPEKYSLNLLSSEIIVFNIKLPKKNKHSKIVFIPYREIIKT